MSNLLRRAKQVLKDNGWIKGAYFDQETGKYCALGALRQAKAIAAEEDQSVPFSREWQLRWINLERDYEEAERLLLDTINDLYGDRAKDMSLGLTRRSLLSPGFDYIQKFNDADDTKEEDIMHALSHASDEWDLTHES